MSNRSGAYLLSETYNLQAASEGMLVVPKLRRRQPKQTMLSKDPPLVRQFRWTTPESVLARIKELASQPLRTAPTGFALNYKRRDQCQRVIP